MASLLMQLVAGRTVKFWLPALHLLARTSNRKQANRLTSHCMFPTPGGAKGVVRGQAKAEKDRVAKRKSGPEEEGTGQATQMMSRCVNGQVLVIPLQVNHSFKEKGKKKKKTKKKKM